MKQYLDFQNIPDWEPLSVCIYKINECSFLNVKNSKNEEHFCQFFRNDAMPLYFFHQFDLFSNIFFFSFLKLFLMQCNRDI